MHESNENLNDLDLQKAFEVILSEGNLSGVIYEIAKLISIQSIDYIFRSIPTHFRIETFQFQTES